MLGWCARNDYFCARAAGQQRAGFYLEGVFKDGQVEQSSSYRWRFAVRHGRRPPSMPRPEYDAEAPRYFFNIVRGQSTSRLHRQLDVQHTTRTGAVALALDGAERCRGRAGRGVWKSSAGTRVFHDQQPQRRRGHRGRYPSAIFGQMRPRRAAADIEHRERRHCRCVDRPRTNKFQLTRWQGRRLPCARPSHVQAPRPSMSSHPTCQSTRHPDEVKDSPVGDNAA